jgi:HSP20 family protein
VCEVPGDRDLFANFERMRREMDELFGDVFDRRLSPRRRGGFSPAVDIYYTSDPPRAVVRADLAGIDPSEIELEIRGRELILAGHRRPAEDTERVYQQLEIEHGPFRRAVPLGVDVDAEAAKAVYEDGMLIVELPMLEPEGSRTVSIQPARPDTEGNAREASRAPRPPRAPEGEG